MLDHIHDKVNEMAAEESHLLTLRNETEEAHLQNSNQLTLAGFTALYIGIVAFILLSAKFRQRAQAMEGEIAAQKRAEDKAIEALRVSEERYDLIKRANFDPLTDLVNRRLFESRLDMALARKKRIENGVCVLFLDLDNFKQVNDSLGHAAGDHLLQHVAQQLKQSIRPYDTVARFGGDEFALLIEGVKQADDCAAIAHNIIKKITEPLSIANKQIVVDVSIGIAMCLAGKDLSREDLMRQADEAMYVAKLTLNSEYKLYSQGIHEQAAASMGSRTTNARRQ
jgi:diguanylate cyclase (GGDEF)-like protein